MRKEINLTKHVKTQTAGRRRRDREDLVGDNAAFSMIMTGKTVRDRRGGGSSGGALYKVILKKGKGEKAEQKVRGIKRIIR